MKVDFLGNLPGPVHVCSYTKAQHRLASACTYKPCHVDRITTAKKINEGCDNIWVSLERSYCRTGTNILVASQDDWEWPDIMGRLAATVGMEVQRFAGSCIFVLMMVCRLRIFY